MKMDNKGKILKNFALVTQIGISMLIPILGGMALGHFLDDKFKTDFIFLILFSILGIITAFISLFKLTTKDIERK